MQALTRLTSFLAQKLPYLSADKCHVLLVNGKQHKGYINYTARILILDYRDDPLQVIAVIRQWLKDQNLHLDQTQEEIEISFSSEIIDTNTFDLEIDFPQREKIVIDQSGYQIFGNQVWSDKNGKFVTAGEE